MVGPYGLFCADESPRAILAADSADLQGHAKWMNDVCVAAGDEELSGWILHLFGSSTCPECEANFKLEDAIAGSRESTDDME